MDVKSLLLVIFFSQVPYFANGLYYPKYSMSKFCNVQTEHVVQLTDSRYASALILNGLDKDDHEMPANVTCSITVQAADGLSFAFHVHKLFVDEASATFEVIQRKTGRVLMSSTFGNDSKTIVTEIEASEPLIMQIRTWKTLSNSQLDVDLVLTSFVREKCPMFMYFDCGSSRRCVREQFRCDGVNNCGNNYDETHCKELTFSALILIMMCILTILLIVVFRTFKKILTELTEARVHRKKAMISVSRTELLKADELEAALREQTVKPLI